MKRTQRRLAERPTEDFLHREIPRVVLPERKHSCPLCALELKGKETRCPRCGVPLSVQREEEMLECPECGSLAPFGARSCPKCGVGFVETPGPPPPEEIPPPEPIAPVPPPPRPVPEIRTAVPATPPSAAKGFVNGTGAVNGTGLVNGTGMINGTKAEARLGVSKKQKMFIARWQFLAVLIAIVIVIPTFIYLSYSQEAAPFAVDGDFGEWDHVEMFGMHTYSGSSSIDVEDWAVEVSDTRMFFYVATGTPMMSSSDVSSIYLFIDADDSFSTGYIVSEVGAEYLLQVDGWNGTIQAATLSEYGSTTDPYDWNSWDSIGSLSVMLSGAKLEAMAEMPDALDEYARFLLMSQNNVEQRSVSYVVPAEGGLLVIEQEAGPDVPSSGIVSASSNVEILRLRLRCEGADGTLVSIVPSADGASVVSVVEDITLQVGSEEIVDVAFDTSQASAGSLISAWVSSSGVETAFADIQIVGETVKAYVSSPPTTIAIDGAFADWSGKTTADSDSPGTVQNENIDIVAVGAVNDTTFSAFYVSVVGEMCGGSFVPVIKEKPAGGGGGGGLPSRKTGEDILKIYIDSDLNSSSGLQVSLGAKLIGGDYLLVVNGLNGKIVSRSLMRYSLSQWIYASGSVDAAKDEKRLEAGVSSSSIGGASSIEFIVEMTDWRPKSDFATAVPQGTRVMPTGLPRGASILSWSVDSSTTSASATAMSYQRKLFYDGVNLWSFYFDGTNTVYKYSTDSGQTWTSGGQAFSGAGVDEASLWYDSSTNLVYIIGDTASASTTVHIRRGVVSPATHTITWSAPDSTPTVSTIALGGKNTYISKDRAGYLWLMSSNCTQAAPMRYELSVFVSVLPDSVQSWRHSGNMLTGIIQGQPNVKGSIVNIGSGSDMLAVYTYQGNVASRVLTASWSAQTVIYSIGMENPGNTDLAPPSVVVDGSGIAHVVYGNGHEQSANSLPFIYYVYYQGSSWSVPYRLDTVKNNEGNFYPTISLDSSTGNVMAFWIETTGKQGLTIQAKKNVSGTWISVPVTGDTTFVKQYLTSIYSAPNEQLIAWQWTQNTTAPIEVLFDMMPEFSDLVLPVLGIIGFFIAVFRRNRTDRRRYS